MKSESSMAPIGSTTHSGATEAAAMAEARATALVSTSLRLSCATASTVTFCVLRKTSLHLGALKGSGVGDGRACTRGPPQPRLCTHAVRAAARATAHRSTGPPADSTAALWLESCRGTIDDAAAPGPQAELDEGGRRHDEHIEQTHLGYIGGAGWPL